MGFGFVLLLRIIQALVAIVVLGLSIYVANWYNSETLTASPSQFNFLVFASVWALLSILYREIVPRQWPRGSHPLAHIALEFTTTVFYLSGFIALAVFLSKLLFCRGSVCKAARVDVGFAAFSFCLWAVTTAILGVQTLRGGLRNVQGGQPTRQPTKRETTMVPQGLGA